MAVKKKVVKKRTRSYLAKDFSGFRSDLLKYARVFYPDNIQDFSEASLGGLFLDMAAYVGDTMSFYLDHQFRELDPSTAVEIPNIERHAQNAGVKISGASPAVALVDFYIKVLAVDNDGVLEPESNALPVIQEGTVVSSTSGVKFVLTEDLDFSVEDYFGNLVARTIQLKTTGSKSYFALVLTGLCVSGVMETQTFNIASSHIPFRTLTLNKSNVSTVLQVMDSEGNEYYEVDNLSQDTVFKPFPNPASAIDGVKSVLGIISAPYRFVSYTDLKTRQRKLKFGGGNASSIEDDGVPDPSDLSLSLYGKKTMSRFSIDPNALLDTKTLGIAPAGTTISVVYRYGGGAAHNVSAGSIKNLNTLRIKFKDACIGTTALLVRNSIEVKNEQPASGGAAQKSVEEIRTLIPAAKNMQARIVTKEDLIARLYMLPNEYGTIYRAGITENPNNPLGSILYIISRDKRGKLTTSPDVLKQNISTYLNEFRMISDAIDILDVQILNFRVDCSIAVAPNANKYEVIKMVIDSLKDLFKLSKMQVGQPIIEADAINEIINIQGVLSLVDLRFVNMFGEVNGRTYSDQSINMEDAKSNGIFFPTAGGIFELRFPNEDIRVTVR